MHPSPDRDAELYRWARDRAPALLAEAEREAVRVLRDALVESATRGTDAKPTPEPARTAAPPADAEPAVPGELLWAYCVIRAVDAPRAELPGVHPAGHTERVESGGLAALVSRVPRSEFGAEPLRRNLNDLEWLERVARAHEAVLEAVLEQATIVPLRMCTLYESADSVRTMLEREQGSLIKGLESLDGRVEWAVKVTVDSDRLLTLAREEESRGSTHEGASTHEEAPATGGEGSAYMLRRRDERRAREWADSLAADIAERVHARLQDWAIDAVLRPPQNPDLSGHEGRMVLNAAYLVDSSRVDELRRIVVELEEHHRELGARIELTGPWPPYNFVPGGDAEALA